MKPPRDDGEARLLKRLTVHRKAKSQLGTPTSRAGETTPGSTGAFGVDGRWRTEMEGGKDMCLKAFDLAVI